MTDFTDTLAKCYWCGELATGKDHVPPQNIFPIGHRNNLIKVSSCKKHNEEFSKLDERMRFHMTLLGDDKIARNHFETKISKGLSRKEGIGLTVDLASKSFEYTDGKRWQRDDSVNFDLYFEKIMRGLFYYHFENHLTGSISYFSNKMEHIEMSAEAHFYYYLLEDDLNGLWTEGSPSNKEIFDYKYHYSQSEERFFIVMLFFGVHKVIGVTIPPNKNIDSYGVDFEDYRKRIKSNK